MYQISNEHKSIYHGTSIFELKEILYLMIVSDLMEGPRQKSMFDLTWRATVDLKSIIKAKDPTHIVITTNERVIQPLNVRNYKISYSINTKRRGTQHSAQT